mmetsp:Transcript_34116/g.105446  ORF Transcript_34116/g.105446 Transcript_34116/m.105446 type:complete len:253 (+) Transcript_34116:1540-2298(+)
MSCVPRRSSEGHVSTARRSVARSSGDIVAAAAASNGRSRRWRQISVKTASGLHSIRRSRYPARAAASASSVCWLKHSRRCRNDWIVWCGSPTFCGVATHVRTSHASTRTSPHSSTSTSFSNVCCSSSSAAALLAQSSRSTHKMAERTTGAGSTTAHWTIAWTRFAGRRCGAAATWQNRHWAAVRRTCSNVMGAATCDSSASSVSSDAYRCGSGPPLRALASAESTSPIASSAARRIFTNVCCSDGPESCSCA